MQLKDFRYKSGITALAIALLLTACGSSPRFTSDDLFGQWYIEYIGDEPVLENSQATLDFKQEGKLAGNASCNSFFGRYRFENFEIHFSELGTTRKRCIPAIDAQEQRFLSALPKARSMVFEHGLMVLRDDNEKALIKASRKP